MKPIRSELATQLVKFALKMTVRIVIPSLIIACDHVSRNFFGKSLSEIPY